ncbi:MAG: DNA translocase FtsK [Paramuribaculum sp.]|nr:DNA translocase FtsK [Paramuribaculum sp.]
MTHTGILGTIGVNILLVSAVVLVFLKEIQSVYSLYRERMERYHEKMERERAEAEARRRKAAEMLKDTDEPVSPADAEEATPVEDTPEEEMPEKETPIEEKAAAETILTRDERAMYVPDTTVAIETPEDVFEKPEAYKPKESVSHEDVMDEIPEMAEVTVMDEVVEETSDVTLTVNAPAEVKEARHIQTDVYDPTAELSRFRFPSIDLLEKREQRTDHVDIAEQEENKDRLTKTLSTYGVKISHIEATVGPTITRYEVIPAEGERIRSIKNLGDDLALSLSALGIRIIAPIPGKGTIGIEVPNKDPQIVSMRSILASEKFQNSDYELPIAMGRTITNDIYIADLAKLPHLLVAGATGMGKSVGLNAILASLLYKKHPAELKFVLVDPKRVELSLYRKLERHYLAALPGEDPIITDTSKVVAVLNSLCIEMGNRLSLLEDAGVRNIKEYNAKFIARRLNPEKHRFMPYIVLVIDEFADIILTAGREVESPVSRLAAVARAAGIHLILATQRPAVNVITGGIKTNIPGRIAFRTIQSIDSRTILDRTGAEQLVGKGDMIFSRDGVLERVQCAFIDTEEVKSICESISEQIGYDRPYDLPEFVAAPAEGGASAGGPLTDRDPLFEECARAVVDANLGSASYLQRKFNIGYPRAGKIIDQLEAAGIVGPPQGGKPRQVLMDMTALENYLTNSGSNK